MLWNRLRQLPTKYVHAPATWSIVAKVGTACEYGSDWMILWCWIKTMSFVHIFWFHHHNYLLRAGPLWWIQVFLTMLQHFPTSAGAGARQQAGYPAKKKLLIHDIAWIFHILFGFYLIHHLFIKKFFWFWKPNKFVEMVHTNALQHYYSNYTEVRT